MSVPCFLIAHPKGTMMWDVGVIPDARIGETIGGATATRTLTSQMAEIGYQPSDITYLALSHAHRDHSANANTFAGSTWLTPLADRDFMFAGGNPRVDPSYYDKPKTSKTITAPMSTTCWRRTVVISGARPRPVIKSSC
jgi:glyoxylase-like metal-dependent hydrolase (beta-lactamase superfamily II)